MTDNVPHTLALDYAALGSAGAVREKLASLGVTHVGVADAPDQDSLAAELLFRAFVALGTRPLGTVSGWRLSALEPRVTAEPAPWVLVAGCGKPIADGLDQLAELAVPLPAVGLPQQFPAPRESGPAGALIGRAGYVVVDPACAPQLDLTGLRPLGPRGGMALYLRN